VVTVRDMDSRAQAVVPVSELSGYLAEQATAARAQDTTPLDTAPRDTAAQDSAG
jgi:hypothetical protein